MHGVDEFGGGVSDLVLVWSNLVGLKILLCNKLCPTVNFIRQPDFLVTSSIHGCSLCPHSPPINSGDLGVPVPYAEGVTHCLGGGQATFRPRGASRKKNPTRPGE